MLVFLATGQGKSLIFALPAVVLKGVTFVLEPLKEVQVELARKFNAVGVKCAVYARDKVEVHAHFKKFFKKLAAEGESDELVVPYK